MFVITNSEKDIIFRSEYPGVHKLKPETEA